MDHGGDKSVAAPLESCTSWLRQPGKTFTPAKASPQIRRAFHPIVGDHTPH
jgi:hypothetical protein